MRPSISEGPRAQRRRRGRAELGMVAPELAEEHVQLRRAAPARAGESMSSFVLALFFFAPRSVSPRRPSVFLYPFAEKVCTRICSTSFSRSHERVATDGIAGGMEALPEKVETVSLPPEVVKPRAGRGNLSGILVLSSLAVVSMITFSYLATLMRVHEKQVEKAELVEQLSDDTGSDEEYDEEEYLAEENEGEQLPDEAPEEPPPPDDTHFIAIEDAFDSAEDGK